MIDDEARQGLREPLKFSLIVVAIVPVLMMYPFMQKYFVRGVMIGSIAGERSGLDERHQSATIGTSAYHGGVHRRPQADERNERSGNT